MRLSTPLLVFCCLNLVGRLPAQVIDDSDTRVQTTLDPGLKRIGTLRPKDVREVGASDWALGCETLDREYADFDSYKDYLPALGIGRIRLQAGWARIEKDPGIYDYGWLDHIIDDARARGLEVWLETSYGNPAYPGGGGRTLADGFPTSEAGLKAWDAWIEKTAERYKGKVRDWSVWNEPELRDANPPAAIFEFNVRTARIIKRVIPDARIAGLSAMAPNVELIEAFAKHLADRGEQDLFTWIVYHHYTRNPDDRYDQVDQAREAVARLTPGLRLWQGEAGVQSEWGAVGALSKYSWTESSQAKWLARRMLGDLGHGSISSVFTAADLDYRTTSFHNGLLRYGLIKTAGAVDGYRVLKVKTAYYAVQNVASVFNAALEPAPDLVCEASCERPTAVYGRRDAATGRHVVAFWDRSAVPTDANATIPMTLKASGGRFDDPVWVDAISGGVYALPPEKVVRSPEAVEFRDVPAYDAPAFIIDRDLLSIIPANH